jgi:hypothetical protein
MQREDLLPSTRVTELLEAALAGRPKVYEAYSEYDAPTKVFTDGDALITHVSALRSSGKSFFNFSFHFPEMDGDVSTVRIALRPEKCSGATWRETTRGWGLIHIQITDQSGSMSKVSVSVNSEKRARTWAETITDQGDPRLWNWKAVDSQARRIIRVLRRLSS